MSGSVAGGRRAAITNKERYGDDFYTKIGRIGGRNGTTCGILYSMSKILPIPSHPKYRVSNDGQVFGLSGKAMKPQVDAKGYLRVLLRDSTKHNNIAPKKVHRLVAETFIPNPKNLPQVDHLDLDKSNNNVSNLEWVTNEENMRRAVEQGAYAKRKPLAVTLLGGQVLTAIQQGYYAKDLFENSGIVPKSFWKYVENGDVSPEPVTTLQLGRKKKYCYFDKSRGKWRVEASDGKTGKQFDTEAEAIAYAHTPISGGFADNRELARIAGAKGGRKSRRGKKNE